MVKGTLPLYKPPQALTGNNYGQKTEQDLEGKSKALNTQNTIQDTTKLKKGLLFKSVELQKSNTKLFSANENQGNK